MLEIELIKNAKIISLSEINIKWFKIKYRLVLSDEFEKINLNKHLKYLKHWNRKISYHELNGCIIILAFEPKNEEIRKRIADTVRDVSWVLWLTINFGNNDIKNMVEKYTVKVKDEREVNEVRLN
mgnify:CR=1 FL=1